MEQAYIEAFAAGAGMSSTCCECAAHHLLKFVNASIYGKEASIRCLLLYGLGLLRNGRAATSAQSTMLPKYFALHAVRLYRLRFFSERDLKRPAAFALEGTSGPLDKPQPS
eukprot:6214558-Pleurochrysis_carterae.AAC.3